MEASSATTPPPDAPPAPAEGNGAPPADPPPPPPDPAASSQSGGQTAAAAKDTNREYTVVSDVVLDLSTAASKKESIEKLVGFLVEAQEGKLTVSVRIGKAMAQDPRKAIKAVGQVRQLAGDYVVVADNARNEFKNVKTSTEVNVSIG